MIFHKGAPRTAPRVGERRAYDGELRVLYPGEQASAHVPEEAMESAAREACNTGRAVTLAVTEWLVEPAPGWRAALLRWRYRLVGQWVDRWRRRMRT